MKNKKSVNVEMYRVVGDLNPFVKVGFVDKDAEEHTGLMMLDSGSNVNLLSCEADRYIGNMCRHDDAELEITDSVGETMIADYVHFSFAFGGEQFNENFGIDKDCHLGNVEDLPIIGLLGNKFMQQHGLVIDYSDFTVHTSDISRTGLCASECDFIFPMEVGLKNYGLPVLAIHHDETDAAVLADTGSSANVVSTQCISQCDLKCEYKDENETLNGLKGSSEARWANVSFNLPTLREDCAESIPFHDSFMVINHPVAEGYVYNDDVSQPIEGMIGSPFMAKQGWTLDFAQKVIYKRKCQTNLIG
jgi:hypothetical protein